MGLLQLVWRAMVATRMGAVGMRPKMADYAALIRPTIWLFTML
jgi:hypothetical protein